MQNIALRYFFFFPVSTYCSLIHPPLENKHMQNSFFSFGSSALQWIMFGVWPENSSKAEGSMDTPGSVILRSILYGNFFQKTFL